MQPFSLLLSVATGIRTMMYCKNDGLRDYQQEMKLRLFKEWEFHRSVMVQMPTGTGKTHLLAAVVKEFLCGIGYNFWKDYISGVVELTQCKYPSAGMVFRIHLK